MWKPLSNEPWWCGQSFKCISSYYFPWKPRILNQSSCHTFKFCIHVKISLISTKFSLLKLMESLYDHICCIKINWWSHNFHTQFTICSSIKEVMKKIIGWQLRQGRSSAWCSIAKYCFSAFEVVISIATIN